MSTTNTPIILLAGEAGAGKDTVGEWIAAHYAAVTIGHADPMKRFCRDVFGFSEEQLWGPSELRNAPDPTLLDRFPSLRQRFDDVAEDWVGDVLPDSNDDQFDTSCEDLEKWFVGMLLLIAEGKPVSPRIALQTLGNEWGREQNTAMWSNYAIEVSFTLLQGGARYSRAEGLIKDVDCHGFDYVIITDARYRNEILGVRGLGGLAIKLDRVTDRSLVQTAGVKNHPSEKLDLIPKHFYTRIVANDEQLPQLFFKMVHIMASAFEDDRGWAASTEIKMPASKL